MDSTALAFPKPTKQSARRRARHKRKVSLIADIRQAVMARDESCRVCGEPDGLHMHEVVFRSAGRSLVDTFSLVNCLALCCHCHTLIHARCIWLSFEDSAVGCNGPVIVSTVRP